jgi:hypothetical protein
MASQQYTLLLLSPSQNKTLSNTLNLSCEANNYTVPQDILTQLLAISEDDLAHNVKILS